MSVRKKKTLGNGSPRPSRPNEGSIVHHYSRYVTLVEDTFGMLFDSADQPLLVKRFTWTNHNKISVSVITYGARIISIRLPDRGANVEEVALGFDDLAGYLFYENYGLSATCGRTTTKLFKSTYVADGQQYWLQPNDGEHHDHGGDFGLDKVNWVPYVQGKMLQLSYMSRDGHQGYPGDLHVRMTFELTAGAEFRISITANTTKVTPVDITNQTYVNLAGHEAGEEELKNHELLINSNCYTPMDKANEFPTGEIRNVVHTRYNFQVPRLLKTAMGEGLDGAYDQNFCVNRGVHQSDAFVARLIHPYKGRVLEIYSNQPGVNFCNASDFPDEQWDVSTELGGVVPMKKDITTKDESVFLVISKLAEYFREEMGVPLEEYSEFLRNLTKKLLVQDTSNLEVNSVGSLTSQLELIGNMAQYGHGNFNDYDMVMLLKPLELRFLVAMKNFLPSITEDMSFELVKESIDEILNNQIDLQDTTTVGRNSFIDNLIDKQIGWITQKDTGGEYQEEEEGGAEEEPVEERKSALRNSDKRPSEQPLRCGVRIPHFYKSNRITGRGGVIYKRYAGIALRTQGYPNALQHERFPSPILRPNETYRHTITYKFWILAGNPAKWLRRLQAGPCVDVSDPASKSSSDCRDLK